MHSIPMTCVGMLTPNLQDGARVVYVLAYFVEPNMAKMYYSHLVLTGPPVPEGCELVIRDMVVDIADMRDADNEIDARLN